MFLDPVSFVFGFYDKIYPTNLETEFCCFCILYVLIVSYREKLDKAQTAFIFFANLLLHLSGNYIYDQVEVNPFVITFFPMFSLLVLGAVEFIHYSLFNLSEMELIPVKIRVIDILKMIVAGFPIWLISVGGMTFDKRSTNPTSYLTLLILMIIWDLLFGFVHYCSHSNIFLMAKHKVHHEYQREELCIFASFHSEALDSFLMNSPILIVTYLARLAGLNYVFILEIIRCSYFSHFKYPRYYLSLSHFYKLDFFLDLIASFKLPLFHYSHHIKLTECFSVFGLIKDSDIKKIYSVFAGLTSA